ncbi:MAG TPA: hypothetical protein VMV68_07180, partial [Spirochaetia bacterium]|nr:hypothetical protein [Spirochaetia bacterium]
VVPTYVVNYAFRRADNNGSRPRKVLKLFLDIVIDSECHRVERPCTIQGEGASLSTDISDRFGAGNKDRGGTRPAARFSQTGQDQSFGDILALGDLDSDISVVQAGRNDTALESARNGVSDAPRQGKEFLPVSRFCELQEHDPLSMKQSDLRICAHTSNALGAQAFPKTDPEREGRSALRSTRHLQYRESRSFVKKRLPKRQRESK